MTRRQLFTGLLFLFPPSMGTGHAQVSQRARQIQDRRACELDLPSCKPHIRIQLEAEERRILSGLVALGTLIFLGFAYFWVRARKMSAGGERINRR